MAEQTRIPQSLLKGPDGQFIYADVDARGNNARVFIGQPGGMKEFSVKEMEVWRDGGTTKIALADGRTIYSPFQDATPEEIEGKKSLYTSRERKPNQTQEKFEALQAKDAQRLKEYLERGTVSNIDGQKLERLRANDTGILKSLGIPGMDEIVAGIEKQHAAAAAPASPPMTPGVSIPFMPSAQFLVPGAQAGASSGDRRLAFLLKNGDDTYVYADIYPSGLGLRVFTGKPGEMVEQKVKNAIQENSARRTNIKLEDGGQILIPQSGTPTYNGRAFQSAPQDVNATKLGALKIPGGEKIVSNLAGIEVTMAAIVDQMKAAQPPRRSNPPFVPSPDLKPSFQSAAVPPPQMKPAAPTQEELARSIIASTPAVAPGVNVTVYGPQGTSAMVLGAAGTMEKMSVEAVAGDPSKVKLKSAEAPDGHVMSVSDAKQAVRYVNGKDTQQLLGAISLIEMGARAPSVQPPVSPKSPTPAQPQITVPPPQPTPRPADPDVSARDEFFKKLAAWERGDGPQPQVPESMKAKPETQTPVIAPPAPPAVPSGVSVALNVSPAPQMQELVRTLGAEKKNMVFGVDMKSALEQQSLMASPAMLDSMKDAGVKHIFVTGYRQDMQDFSTAVWDAARTGDSQQLNAQKQSFVRAMELQRGPDPLNLRDNAVPPGQEGALYRGTADMIGEAAKRGIQVHFTAEADPRGLQQVARDKLDPDASSRLMRERNDHESEFIKLTAQDERYAVITGDRRMQGENGLAKKLDDTVHIGLSGAAPQGPRDTQPDYSYSMRDMKLEDMKVLQRPPAPSAPQSTVPASSFLA